MVGGGHVPVAPPSRRPLCTPLVEVSQGRCLSFLRPQLFRHSASTPLLSLLSLLSSVLLGVGGGSERPVRLYDGQRVVLGELDPMAGGCDN